MGIDADKGCPSPSFMVTSITRKITQETSLVVIQPISSEVATTTGRESTTRNEGVSMNGGRDEERAGQGGSRGGAEPARAEQRDGRVDQPRGGSNSSSRTRSNDVAMDEGECKRQEAIHDDETHSRWCADMGRGQKACTSSLREPQNRRRRNTRVAVLST